MGSQYFADITIDKVTEAKLAGYEDPDDRPSSPSRTSGRQAASILEAEVA
jgi:hypothetical protein